MEHKAERVPIEALLANTAWVHGLARRLLGSSELADEVVQDTWVACLERPGTAHGGSRAWLARVVHNLLRQRGRSETARRGRELASARTEALPSTAQLVARARTGRRLLAAVLDLDEPYRTAVLLRYFEGVTPEVIAARQGVPASTVRSWLARARERLRSRLEREAIGRADRRAAWFSAFLGRLMEVSTVGSTKTVVGVGLVALGGVAWLGWNGRGERDPGAPGPPRSPAEVALQPAAEARAAGEGAGRVSSQPEPLAAGELPPVPPDVVVDAVTVAGALREPDGSTVDSWLASVTLVAEDGRELRAEVESRGAGYRIEGLAPGRYELRAFSIEHQNLVRQLLLDGLEPEVEADLVLVPAQRLWVTFLMEDGSTLEAWRSSLGLSDEIQPAVVPSLDRPRGDFPPTQERAVGRTHVGHYVGRAGGRGNFDAAPPGAHGALWLREPAPLYASAVLRHAVLDTQEVSADQTELVFTVRPEDLLGRLASLRLRLVEADRGEPLSAGAVSLTDSQSWHPGLRPDASGEVRFDRRMPGLFHLSVEVPGYAILRRVVELGVGQDLDLGDVPLAPALELSGTIVGPNGGPCPPGALLAWFPLADFEEVYPVFGSHSYSTDDGRFRLSGLGPQPTLIWVRGKARNDVLGAFAIDPGREATRDLRLELQPRRRVTFEVAQGAALRVQLVTAEGLPALPAFELKRGNPEERDLPSGHYEARARDPDGRELRQPFAVAEVDLRVTL